MPGRVLQKAEREREGKEGMVEEEEEESDERQEIS